MRCPKCQAENPDDAEYCSLCFSRFRTEDFIDGNEETIKLREKHAESLLRCPSCDTLSPVTSTFCLSCGFTFDDIGPLIVAEEEIDAQAKVKEDIKKKEQESLCSTPIAVCEDSEGAEVMRGIEDILKKGQKAVVHTQGRSATTHAMKIIALMSEELYKRNSNLLIKVNLLSEGAVTYLEDVELELILEANEVKS
jgi:hypothetical protein